MKKFIVITSIHEPSAAIQAYAALADWQVVLVGDRKGPAHVADSRITFLSLERQAELGFEYATHCPENHYARKNLGYLYAISQGADVIAETDDDNSPLKGWGGCLEFSARRIRRASGGQYFNAYKLFTDETVWPRGFPLREVLRGGGASLEVGVSEAEVAVWQELADEDPDVDAIFRLTRGGMIKFRPEGRIVLASGVYCPFNSQNTFWRREAFGALFLPGRVTMRYCDILRGYVAQPLFWARGMHLGFGPPTVRQLRNEHDLMKDFLDELPMYRDVESVIEVLGTIVAQGSITEGLVDAYDRLSAAGLVPAAEVAAARAWSADLARLDAGI